MGEPLRVEVLGPLRVRDAGGVDCTPEGPLLRRLLALLVLRRGTTVSVDVAADVLWPADPPRDPAAALQTHLFRLRKRLPDGAIESDAGGYRLDPAAIVVDADELARAEDADALAAALHRWRGPAYPELADDDAGRAEAVRLEELRAVAAERLAQLRLDAGGAATDGLVADLHDLVAAHPLRERPRELLMAALAAEGRAAEALRAYDDFRRLLAEELGIEPSAALAARHAELLGGGSGAADRGWTPQHRLPAAATSILGRDELAATAVDLVAAHRLVTLLGFGGVGKTRLLLEVGARLPRPVVWCELATASVESAVDVVAGALAIEGRPGVGLTERLAQVLADAELVLLLDNCEHVLEPVAALATELLARCPGVRMVATSRERLRVAGEQLCPVGPLPDADVAEQLFVERAGAVRPGYVPTPEERACIGEIVRRLDGLPLAIELAAARLHTLDVADVAAGLDRRFGLLDAGPRTSTRHRSLGAAVEWSVGLLDDDLRRTFVDLGVFAGPFDLAGATAVAGVDDPGAVAAALDQLVERSLVQRVAGRRYALLETLRAYGTDRLAAEGRADAVRRRHAEHTVRWAEAAGMAMADPGREGILLEYDGALPELRSALAWLIDARDLEWAGRLVAAIEHYAFLRLRPDVLAWADRVTAIDPQDEGPLADAVWAISAFGAWMAGKVPEGGVRARRATTIGPAAGRAQPIQVLSIQGSYGLFEGRLADAAHWFGTTREAAGADDPVRRLLSGASQLLALAYGGEEAAASALSAALLAESESLAGPPTAYAWYCVGEADLTFGAVDRARQRLDRAIELAEATHAAFVVGVAESSRTSIEAKFGDPHVAAARLRQLLADWRRAGMWGTQWTTLRTVAGVLEALGRPEDAAVLAGAVVATDAGHRIFGEDEAALTALGERLRVTLGHDAYTAALNRGAVMDGEAAVAHALAALETLEPPEPANLRSNV